MTLYELDLLATAWRRQQEREDRRASLAPWILAAINRDTEKQREPIAFEDVVSWLGHGFQRERQAVPRAAPPTPEELKSRIDVVHLLHQGLYGENGTPALEDG